MKPSRTSKRWVASALAALLFASVSLLPTFAVASSNECSAVFEFKVSSAKLPEAEVRRRTDLVFSSLDGLANLVSRTTIATAKNLLFKDQIEPASGSEFLASNEFDWHLTPMDQSPTDVLIGFGTNSAWDLAVRKKAKVLVIGDWSEQPLMGQEYFIRPLLLTARSRADFLSMLSGIPVPAEVASGPIEGVFSYINRAYNRGDQEFFKQARVHVKETIIRLAENPKVTDEQLAFTTTYLAALVGVGTPPFKTSLQKMMFYQFYAMRYNPAQLRAAGASEKDLSDPYFSVFSSEAAFDRLQKLFDGNIYYVQTSITTMAAYENVKKLAGRNGLERVTVSTSNVFDCGIYNGLDFAQYQKYLRSLTSLFSNEGRPLVAFRVTNTRPPHEFYRYELNNAPQVDRDVQEYPQQYRRAN